MVRALILCALLAAPICYADPTVAISVSPSTGLAPLDVIVTWASTGATACNASGGWSGAKALTGSQLIAGVMSTRSFTLTCSGGTGSATLSWTQDMHNTNGSVLTNLAGYNIYHGDTWNDVDKCRVEVCDFIQVGVSSQYTFTGLGPGPEYAGVRARSSDGVLSYMSNILNLNVAVPSATATATVTIQTQPRAPVCTSFN